MKRYFQNEHIVLYHSPALPCLREMPDESVQCVITSPPYWKLRDYKEKGQLGMENTPEEYIEKVVVIFREIRRVLRKDGTLWLNMGDSYASNRMTGVQGKNGTRANREFTAEKMPPKLGKNLKSKDMVGMPWRVALALQEDSWWLRSEIIWFKPNPLPESVSDRPTKSHENIFLLTRSGESLLWAHRDKPYSECIYEKPSPDYLWTNQFTGIETKEEPDDWRDDFIEINGVPKPTWKRINLWRGCDYYYDNDAIREPIKDQTIERYGRNRNPIPSRDFPGAVQHLDQMCSGPVPTGWDTSKGDGGHGSFHKDGRRKSGLSSTEFDETKKEKREGTETRPPMTMKDRDYNEKGRNKRTVWEVPTAPYPDAHFATFPPDLIEPCILAGSKPGDVVLDPFSGSGTTIERAVFHHRKGLAIEIKEEYCKMHMTRFKQGSLNFYESD